LRRIAAKSHAGVGCVQKKRSISAIANAMKTDLPRFIPQEILSIYQDDNFSDFITVILLLFVALFPAGRI